MKAGLLHSNRMGDQDTGRSMDTLQDERDRGITIKSAAVTLEIMVKKEVLKSKEENKPEKGSLATEAADIDVEYYIGNLPRNYDSAVFETFLKEQGLAPTASRFNLHRGYAFVTMTATPSLLEGIRGTVWQGRSLVVERSGTNAWSLLQELCQREHLNLPSVDVEEEVIIDGNGQHSTKYAAVATWPDIGDVIIQAVGFFSTRKQARHATAKECLAFLGRQLQDHRQNQEPVVADADDVRDDKSTVETAPDSDKKNSLVPMVINLIDSPGHIEFNAEVSAALRVSDGALVVVDAIEGKAVQTEQVLRQTLQEGVRPVLMINKVDRLFLDKQLEADEVYDALQRVVDDINNFVGAHQLPNFPDQRVSFQDGSVAFGSGYFGWSASIDTFVQRQYDHTANTLTDIQRLRVSLAKRENFIKFIIKPIMRMHRASGVLPILNREALNTPPATRVNELLSRVGKKHINSVDFNLPPRKLLKKAMMAWLPAADAIVDMIALHVPSPVQAQTLRAPLLYSGDLTDESGKGISECDPLAPAVVYISKMAGGPKDRKLLAFGRVFSGTVHAGDILRALRTDGTESEAKIARIKIFGVGGSTTLVQNASAGQLVAFEGVDDALDKAGTLTSSSRGGPIRHMTMSVTPTLQHSVRPKEKRQLNKMVTELRKVVNADATALFYKDQETQEYILAGAGELHVEVLISTLLQASGIEVELSEPVIGYRETAEVVSEIALAKSDNKHSRVYIRALPLPKEIVGAMTANSTSNVKDMGKILIKDFGWNSNEASKLWAVGPEPITQNLSDVDRPTCMLVDSTFGLQIPQDFRDNLVAAFLQITRQGVLVNSPLRGVRFELVDAKFHSDISHRRPNSVVPAASRAMRGAFLMAAPSLVEPIYRVDISGNDIMNGAYAVIGQRGGAVVDASESNIQALVPVRRAKGIADALRLATQGQAHCATVYQNMQLVPLAQVAVVIEETRHRKNLNERLPTASDFVDKL